jgi:alpha-aminoadipic semialdehyde synthase
VTQGIIGIRRETKDDTQRRSPLSPRHVKELVRAKRVEVIVEPWEQRIHRDDEYRRAGATISDDLSKANIVFGIKEVAPSFLDGNQTYCFFSHTVKGQAYNMPMLRAMMDHRNTLLDYELVRDATGKRLVCFGEFAGFAGMVDTLWALGKRLQWEGIPSPFHRIRYATEYGSLQDARSELRSVGQRIREKGLDRRLVPFVCGFTGYGRVSRGALRMFKHLPVEEITPADLPSLYRKGSASNRVLYAVTYRKPDMYRPKRAGYPFDLQEFRRTPARYVSRLKESLPYLTLLLNGIFWEPGVPRLMTKAFARSLYGRRRHPRLRVIGDITCDIRGSVELTVATTDSTDPIYVYNPVTGKARRGWKGRGPVILAVDKLPTEFPREASDAFGTQLMPFVPHLAWTDFNRGVAELAVPPEFRNAVILHKGKLTRRYNYLKQNLGS